MSCTESSVAADLRHARTNSQTAPQTQDTVPCNRRTVPNLGSGTARQYFIAFLVGDRVIEARVRLMHESLQKSTIQAMLCATTYVMIQERALEC